MTEMNAVLRHLDQGWKASAGRKDVSDHIASVTSGLDLSSETWKGLRALQRSFVEGTASAKQVEESIADLAYDLDRAKPAARKKVMTLISFLNGAGVKAALVSMSWGAR